MKMIIENNSLKWNEKTIKMEDLDNKSIEAFFRDHINEYHDECIIENEVFII